MYRQRSFYYITCAILVVLSIYTFLSISSRSNPSVLKTPEGTRPDQGSTDSHLGSNPDALDDGVTKGGDGSSVPASSSDPQSGSKLAKHKVDTLIQEADERFEKILSKETYSLEDAAKAYRERRGRHPPPGFDLWYAYAKENKAVMVEEFWDQIYHDLNPFWAIDPAMLRAQARGLDMGAEIKGGKVVKTPEWFWHEIWGRMISTFAEHLPDMYVAMNPMDESRLLVKWEDIDKYVKKADSEKVMVKAKNAIRTITGWEYEGKEPDVELPDPKWNGFNPYRYALRACPPHSHARQLSGVLAPSEIMGHRENSKSKINVTQYFEDDFVSNWTEASDFCSDATIGGLHGALMMPLTCSNTDILMPMFGGSKFHVNNEILLPAPMYWNGEERFGGDGGGDPTPWSRKGDKVLWRGTATGGRSKPFTWYMFHRHRFVAMNNGTRYRHADKNGRDLVFNELLQETAIKTLNPETQAYFGDWLTSTHNVAFTDLVCDENESDGSCWYIKDEFNKVEGFPFAEQFTVKYLPDVDGNSFSGRYRAFLLSKSLPIKATIYREWHDSRLTAWRHFVPMNNRFSDYYRILEYFLGDIARGIAGRDDQAQKIAVQGSEWGAKVLRKVDMQIYVFRLLLEYGRLTDNKRLKIGWVDDLLGKNE